MKANSILMFLAIFLARDIAMSKVRARDLGIPFDGIPGAQNAIVDVTGVLVGHTTLIEDKGKSAIRTGVTAILPAGKVPSKVPAAWYSLNGNGEMTGTTWIEESGMLEGPVMMTNTYSVGVVRDAVRKWAQKKFPVTDPDADDSIALPVVGETWDGLLNDINGFHVTEAHAVSALESASAKNIQEGSVGGGTGMVCYQFKCGIGTSSRVIEIEKRKYTLGVMVQANFGRRPEITIAGIKLGERLRNWMPDKKEGEKKDGSILVILATDAPLLPSQLKRLVRRVPMGIARTGGIAHHSSGDIFLAFSTAQPKTKGNIETWSALKNDSMNEIFRATVQATEESIINALVAGETMIGQGNQRVYGLPHKEVISALVEHKILKAKN